MTIKVPPQYLRFVHLEEGAWSQFLDTYTWLRDIRIDRKSRGVAP